MRARDARGFTLIELMVAVAIIGLLASLAVPKLDSMITRVRRTEYETQLSQYQRIMAQYIRQTGQLPQGNGYVTEPPLGSSPTDLTGWTNPASRFFPGKDLATKPAWYKLEPWRSFTAFGAPTYTHSTARFLLYCINSSGFCELYSFHDFDRNGVLGYHVDLWETGSWVADPSGYYYWQSDTNPDE